MKKKRFITLEDVRCELDLNSCHMISLEDKIECLKLRHQYLLAVEDYFMNNPIQPFLKSNLLNDDSELVKFAMPLLLQYGVKFLKNQIDMEKLKCSKLIKNL